MCFNCVLTTEISLAYQRQIVFFVDMQSSEIMTLGDKINIIDR